MDIVSLGHSSFKIKGKKVTLVTDPFDPTLVGFAFPKHIESDIVTISHQHKDHNNAQAVGGDPFVIQGPGEYEVKGAEIVGMSSYHDDKKGAERGRNIIYHILIDEINLVHLGDLGTTLSREEIEKLNSVDILFIPVGGTFTLGMERVASLISELEPRIVIPMHYRTEKHSKDFSGIASFQEFLKIMGKEDVVPVPKLTVTKEKLPPEMQIVVLE